VSAPFHEAEAIVVAAICGGAWRASLRARDEPVAPDLWAPLLVAATVVGCSLLVVLASTYALEPSLFWPSIVQAVTDDYLRERGVLAGVDQGIFAIEGLLLAAAAASAARHRPQWTAAFSRMLVAGAAGAAALNLTRLLQITLRSPTPLITLRTALQSVRINTGYGDVNAAGSYFALAEVVVCGIALSGNGFARLAALGVAALLAAATWLTGSRAAVAAAIVAVASLLAARLRMPDSRRLALYGLAACGFAGVIFLLLFPNPFTGPEARLSVTVRIEMGRIALRMLGSRPVFGLGIGTFYAASGDYLAASPLHIYYVRENAHNNLLQLTAELGLVGALAAGWLAAAVIRHWRVAHRSLPDDRRSELHVLTAANLAFIATMLLGHPLLTPQVSFVFALSMGAMAGMGADAAPSRRADRWAAAAVALLLIALPVRIHERVLHANMEHVGWGVGEWEADAATGEKMRRPTGHTTLFVPPGVRWIELPCRLTAPASPVRFAVAFRGHRVDDLVVNSTTPARYRLVIAPGARADAYEPLELTLISGDPAKALLGKVMPH
jgi:hypothetical protein